MPPPETPQPTTTVFPSIATELPHPLALPQPWAVILTMLSLTDVADPSIGLPKTITLPLTATEAPSPTATGPDGMKAPWEVQPSPKSWKYAPTPRLAEPTMTRPVGDMATETPQR